jgi:hypothetical protein
MPLARVLRGGCHFTNLQAYTVLARRVHKF